MAFGIGCDSNCGFCGGCTASWERPEPDPRDQPVTDDERVHQTVERIKHALDSLLALGLKAGDKAEVWQVARLMDQASGIAHDHAQTLYARHAEFYRAEDEPIQPPF